MIILFNYNFVFWMGIGDWGLGMGDWGLGPIPNPQSPIPNPQSPIPIIDIYKINNIKNKIIFLKINKLNIFIKIQTNYILILNIYNIIYFFYLYEI